MSYLRCPEGLLIKQLGPEVSFSATKKAWRGWTTVIRGLSLRAVKAHRNISFLTLDSTRLTAKMDIPKAIYARLPVSADLAHLRFDISLLSSFSNLFCACMHKGRPPFSGPRIRLLHVSPSPDENAPISCTLSVHSLNPDLEFTALSYEWGRPYKPTKEHPAPTLNVNGFTIPIQPNLHNALRHLRGNHADLVIWVDAICINQKDDKEKTQQVGLMAELYSSASKTYAWIGLGTDCSDTAMATLADVGREMLRTPNRKTRGGDEGSKGHEETEESTSALEDFEKLTAGAAAEERNVQAPDELLKLAPDLVMKYLPGACFPVVECRGLLSREYWSRMWIQQEVALSSNVVVCCGNSKIPWNVFEAGLVFIMLLMHQATYGVIAKYTNEKGGMV